MEAPGPAAPPQVDPSEAALVERLRQRSPEAFELLVRRHGLALLATARRMLRQDEEANDAVQEAFLSAYRALPNYEARAPLGAWLQQIVVNACLMRLRKRRRLREESIDELLPSFLDVGAFSTHQVPWDEASDAGMEREECASLVREKIDSLPEKFRTPLVLRDLQEMDYEMIAVHMAISVNAAKIRVHRARQALKALLEPHFSQH